MECLVQNMAIPSIPWPIIIMAPKEYVFIASALKLWHKNDPVNPEFL